MSFRKPIPILASYNIPIYKRVYRRKNSLLSAYRGYAYASNTWEPKIPIEIEFVCRDLFCIREGYHGYRKLATAVANRHDSEIVVMGYIKKGTEFYQNEEGTIVAEQIMLIEPEPKNKWYTTILKFIGLG